MATSRTSCPFCNCSADQHRQNRYILMQNLIITQSITVDIWQEVHRPMHEVVPLAASLANPRIQRISYYQHLRGNWYNRDTSRTSSIPLCPTDQLALLSPIT
ncbi:hypothetical protein CEXT_50321 [Caerostris extrusa]|uniref:Uncharacterized protein n=1 Tax=Caerostris extrusa TaxID=172846 RepID=A0AAV4WW51_CAEEX|nr:hypothetical protein CEXT_50321 [Caerostris extrusa]